MKQFGVAVEDINYEDFSWYDYELSDRQLQELRKLGASIPPRSNSSEGPAIRANVAMGDGVDKFKGNGKFSGLEKGKGKSSGLNKGQFKPKFGSLHKGPGKGYEKSKDEVKGYAAPPASRRAATPEEWR